MALYASKRHVRVKPTWAKNALVPQSLLSGRLAQLSPSVIVPTGYAYWVSPTGTATWSSAYSDVPKSGTACCSLATANANASAGDTVYLRGGTYTTQIYPAKSGASTSSKIIYQAYTGETPVITTTPLTGGFVIDGAKSYIKVSGITFQNNMAWGRISNGSHHNEVAYCTFDSSATVGGNKGIYITRGSVGGQPSTHNWIHHCNFSRNRQYIADCDDQGGHVWIGVWTWGDTDDNNTLEDCVFWGGGHHLVETYSHKNVIRRNVFHNEGWWESLGCTWGPSVRNSMYGNRNIQIYDGGSSGGSGTNTAMYNLIEGNRSGHAAFAPDGGMDGNFTITAPKNIIRYNFSYYSETFGLYFKLGAGSNGNNNRAYNNTIYYNGQDSMLYPNAWTGYGDLDWRYSVGANSGSLGNIIKNCIVYQGYSGDVRPYGGSITWVNNWLTANGDPLLSGTDVSDPTSQTKPELALSSGSPCINAGTYLTQANGSGASSVTLIVDDATYFQDGTWGSSLAGHLPDEIAIGTIANTVAISSINRDTNTITLASPRTWSDDAPIWLYKDSSGNRVLYGSAPDIGAAPYQQ